MTLRGKEHRNRFSSKSHFLDPFLQVPLRSGEGLTVETSAFHNSLRELNKRKKVRIGSQKEI